MYQQNQNLYSNGKNQKSFTKLEGVTDNEKRGCNCRRSQCIQLYCECYQKGVYCTPACNCVDCKNNNSHEVNFEKAVYFSALQEKCHPKHSRPEPERLPAKNLDTKSCPPAEKAISPHSQTHKGIFKYIYHQFIRVALVKNLVASKSTVSVSKQGSPAPIFANALTGNPLLFII